MRPVRALYMYIERTRGVIVCFANLACGRALSKAGWTPHIFSQSKSGVKRNRFAVDGRKSIKSNSNTRNSHNNNEAIYRGYRYRVNVWGYRLVEVIYKVTMHR